MTQDQRVNRELRERQAQLDKMEQEAHKAPVDFKVNKGRQARGVHVAPVVPVARKGRRGQ